MRTERWRRRVTVTNRLVRLLVTLCRGKEMAASMTSEVLIQMVETSSFRLCSLAFTYLRHSQRHSAL